MGIRIAIVGLGNCASSLIQGTQFYKAVEPGIEQVPGLITPSIGGYVPSDIEVVAAFDIDKRKVGKRVSDAMWFKPNNTIKFADVPLLDALVYETEKLDGLGSTSSLRIKTPDSTEIKNEADILRETGAEIVVNYLPVGSEMATVYWAGIAVDAGCAFVNCIPISIAQETFWQNEFKTEGLPLVGDDVKSQVGATILHRQLVHLAKQRGFTIDKTYQLNFGGNMDFFNMKDTTRLSSKKKSKTGAVLAELDSLDEASQSENIHVSPSDYVPWLEDQKWAYIHVEGRAFGGVPYKMELKLEVWDSPNSAGVVTDVIRCTKVALDRGWAGALTLPSAYYMKSPPQQMDDALVPALLKEAYND